MGGNHHLGQDFTLQRLLSKCCLKKKRILENTSWNPNPSSAVLDCPGLSGWEAQAQLEHGCARALKHQRRIEFLPQTTMYRTRGRSHKGTDRCRTTGSNTSGARMKGEEIQVLWCSMCKGDERMETRPSGSEHTEIPFHLPVCLPKQYLCPFPVELFRDLKVQITKS